MAGELITITDSAANRVKTLLDNKPEAVGLRVWIKEAGCSGLTYKVDLVEDEPEGDDVIETTGGKVYIDPKAVMYILGTEMDFAEDTFFSGFIFKNPNETSRCGCGESFSI